MTPEDTHAGLISPDGNLAPSSMRSVSSELAGSLWQTTRPRFKPRASAPLSSSMTTFQLRLHGASSGATQRDVLMDPDRHPSDDAGRPLLVRNSGSILASAEGNWTGVFAAQSNTLFNFVIDVVN